MKLYNTLTRNTEEFRPLNDKRVKLYTCGLTVYSQPHVGNWIGYIYWDVLVRALRHEGYTVERTQNITDVGHLTSDDDAGEDKMEKGARSEGITAWDVAEKYSKIAAEEAADLGLIPPDNLVRATEYIPQQIAFAKALEENGYTYIIEGDGLYFDTSKLTDYGKLARLDIAGLEAGARVSVEGKKNITDFAIWKLSPRDSKRDMEWDSPWGVGFPGWHLECSVIARETLGDQLDIHTGGVDHIPVHHTNEIAQTEALTNKQFSTFWLHNNHMKSDGKKMSKSIGNIYTLADITAHGYSLSAFRVFALSKQYRTEGNFSWENIEAAQNRLQNWHQAADLVHQPSAQGTLQLSRADFDARIAELEHSLADDLDTPSALHILDVLADEFSIAARDDETIKGFTRFAQLVEDMLGIQLVGSDITETQKEMLSKRADARGHKQWDESDRLRDELASQGIGIRDNAGNAQSWYRLTV